MAELSRIVLDYRDLGNKVIANNLEEAVREQMVTAVSEYTAGILLSGDWEGAVMPKPAWWLDRHRSAARAIPG